MSVAFDYREFTTRNIGFVSEAEQQRIAGATVFVCGTGGMGGAALLALTRAGIGHFIIADLDRFDVSNLNRQVFAFLGTVGRDKAEATAELMRQINPTVQIEVFGKDWPRTVEDSVRRAAVVVNGTDDLAAGLLLYRTARKLGKPVIDAYASPLPSVYVTRPDQQSPEERLGYPTRGKAWDAITREDRDAAFQAEVIHVMIHSSSRHHVDLAVAGEVAAGRRSRMSFAPMVITTGMMMAYEAIALVLGKSTGTDNRGWFFNPYRPAVEKPRPAIVAAVMRPIVRRFLQKMMDGA
ncbi:MAG: ThiF family adenylyltransferase [Rhizobiaceae bacterium]|nr:ThiF family adenylyltransferase [Rhizobiaceae bacterium]